MNEREQLWTMLRRCKALCDRNTDAICARIVSCRDLQALDYLFAQSKRQHALYMRIYARYEATLMD